MFPSPGHFPPPTTTEELGARILIQERYEKYGESEEVEMEVESEDEDDRRDTRNESHASQPDQDTQLQDMDEVRPGEIVHLTYFNLQNQLIMNQLSTMLWYMLTTLT